MQTCIHSYTETGILIMAFSYFACGLRKNVQRRTLIQKCGVPQTNSRIRWQRDHKKTNDEHNAWFCVFQSDGQKVETFK